MTTPAIEMPGYIAGTWDLDPVHSHIGFAARHMTVSKVRGRVAGHKLLGVVRGRCHLQRVGARRWAPGQSGIVPVVVTGVP